MKLVSLEEFCKMPAGTIFAPYEPMVFKQRLEIKVDGGEPAPYYAQTLHYFNGTMPLEPCIDLDAEFYKIGDQLPASFETYDGSTADYMDERMFAVFEEADVDKMIQVLLWAKNGCVGRYENFDYRCLRW